MRLLHAQTIRLQEFPQNEIPLYAILSHTWEKDEVTFQDMQESRFARKEGYIKIKYACEQALAHQLEYVWVDTCCIDKRSSSELSEAINSMFQWYRNAHLCYAYLVDVPSSRASDSENSPFRKSRWWAREWIYLGSKFELGTVITEITGIDKISLSGLSLRRASIAKRMSWASKMVTTRKEDIAYCLLGIFGVHMPMLYGEGDKAFLRLQEEIIKQSDDQSLLAWGLDGPEMYWDSPTGILARSPAEFAEAGTILPCKTWNTAFPPSMTAKGLRIELPIYYLPSNPDRTPHGLLSCHAEDDFFNLLALPLHPIPRTEDEYTRLARKRPIQVPETESKNLELKTIYIKKLPPLIAPPEDSRLHSFLVRQIPNGNSKHGYHLAGVHPSTAWNASRRIISTRSGYEELIEMQALLHFGNDNVPDFLVVVEYNPKRYNLEGPTDSESSPVQYHIAPKPDHMSLEELRENQITDTPSEFCESLRTAGVDVRVSLNRDEVMGVEMFVLDVDVNVGEFYCQPISAMRILSKKETAVLSRSGQSRDDQCRT